MNKHFTGIISAVCAAAMLSGGAAMLPVHAEEAQTVRIMGDMTGDNQVTMADAKKTLDLVVMSQIGLSDKTVTAETNAADINMNGKLEMADARAILNYFCLTLVDGKPLWSDVRKLTYTDGSDYDPESNFYGENDIDLPFAKRSMYLEIGCASGKAGETVEIPVYIAGIVQLNGFQYFQTAPEALVCEKITSVFGTENNEPAEEFASKLCATTNPEYGAIVWAQANPIPLSVKDGMVIATYSYKIPENAKSGDLFVITPAADELNLFVPDNTSKFATTMLDGVVSVK